MNHPAVAIFCCLLVLATSWVSADVVFLRGGGKIEGRVLERTESSVEVDIGAGSISVSMTKVDRIEEGRSLLDDYDDRAALLGGNDYDGWLDLARWASSEGMGTQARRAYEQVLSISPDDPEANKALGRVEVDGSWMSEEEAYRARGYVQFEGRWMTPAEKESAMREQQASAAAENARLDAKARTAEAQAREAEARAEEAEVQTATEGIPLWWGTWGPGPTAWPTNPTRPVDRPVTGRPVGVPVR